MASVQTSTERKTTTPATTPTELKLEVVVIPVADVERSKAFYTGLGWRLDADFVFDDGSRGVQVTPPGSQCSVIFGSALSSAAPGSAQSWLVVPDIVAARAALVARGATLSEVFHRVKGAPVAGLDPQRRSYSSYASFTDPDGNVWLLQEVTQRLPGRVEALAYTSVTELASALRRAEAAHGVHEAKLGKRDENWPEWYAEYLLREQAGTEPPS